MQTTNNTLDNEELHRKGFKRTMISLAIVYPFVHYTMQIVDSLVILPTIAVFIFPALFLLGLFAASMLELKPKQLNSLKLFYFLFKYFISFIYSIQTTLQGLFLLVFGFIY